MQTVTIESWNDFLGKITITDHAIAQSALKLVYRGEADKDWELRPSLLRLLPTDLFTELVLDIEAKALREFRRRSSSFVRPHEWTDEDAILHWWSIMRHYGAPTRLLDWTYSPYVAAYFAVEQFMETDGAIWRLNEYGVGSNVLHRFSNYEEPFTERREYFLSSTNPFEVMFIDSPQRSERMIAQQGVFSICRNVVGHHGKILSALEDSRPKLIMQKLIIPAGLKREFLDRLRLMNVTASSLFPGLEGLGRSIGELVRLEGDLVRRGLEEAAAIASVGAGASKA